MILNDSMYVPAVRWLGEYQALLRLCKATKDRVVPLITVPEPQFDFELQQPMKIVHGQVVRFPGSFRKKLGGGTSGLDNPK